MSSRRPARVGGSKLSRRSKRPGRSSAGSRLSARFVAAISRMVDGRRDRSLELAVDRQEQVDPVDEPGLDLLPAVRGVEGLHLDEQLVDDPAGALRHHRGHQRPGPTAGGGRERGGRQAREPTAAHRRGQVGRGDRRGRRADARAGHRDGVDLLDEADRTALLARGLAQRLEVGADLARRGAVVHGLEARGRHEEERHAGLGGHRLGQVGLAGSGRALEEQAASRRAAHLGAEGAVGQEEVQRADDVGLHQVDALDVCQRDVDLLGAVRDVRRAARDQRHPEGRDDHDAEEHADDQQERVDRGQRQLRQVDRTAVDDPPPHPDHRDRHQEPDPGEPVSACPLPGCTHVAGGRGQSSRAHLVEHRHLAPPVPPWWGRTTPSVAACGRGSPERASAPATLREDGPRAATHGLRQDRR